jgi:hypothetical protein
MIVQRGMLGTSAAPERLRSYDPHPATAGKARPVGPRKKSTCEEQPSECLGYQQVILLTNLLTAALDTAGPEWTRNPGELAGAICWTAVDGCNSPRNA